MPLAAIKKIITQCETTFDSFTITIVEKESGESRHVKPSERYSPEDRVFAIRKMAEFASLIMIASFKLKLQDALAESVRESDLISESVLASFYGETIKTVVKVMGDVTDDIEKAARRVAENKREFLRSQIKQLPHILAERRRGGSNPRIDVSDEECVKMSEAYPALLKHWKKVAKNRKTEENWRAYAKVDEPSTPEDLLDRLDELPQESDSYNGDYPNIPSALAHEHAARLSGIKANEYSLSSLKLLRRRGDSIPGQMKNSE
jgi:hypothetical protein